MVVAFFDVVLACNPLVGICVCVCVRVSDGMADVSVWEEASPRVYINARRVSQSNANLPSLFVCS